MTGHASGLMMRSYLMIGVIILRRPHLSNTFFDEKTLVPIRIEYFDAGGGAEIAFEWQSNHTLRSIIPSAQLFPISLKNVEGLVWLDLNKNDVLEKIGLALIGHKCSTIQWTKTSNSSKAYRQILKAGFLFERLLPGDYVLFIPPNPTLSGLIPYSGIHPNGFSSTFSLGKYQHIQTQIVYRQDSLSTATSFGIDVVGPCLYPNPFLSNIYFNDRCGEFEHGD